MWSVSAGRVSSVGGVRAVGLGCVLVQLCHLPVESP